jgi:uncharacterized protein (UPF0128 family)
MLDKINNYFAHLNQNNLFLGLAMIIMNVGSRYIEFELSPNHKKFLSSKTAQYILLFIIVFTATRNILTSIIVTVVFVLIVFNLFHEHSRLCVLPKSFTDIDTNKDGELSPEEIKAAYLKLRAQGKID